MPNLWSKLDELYEVLLLHQELASLGRANCARCVYGKQTVSKVIASRKQGRRGSPRPVRLSELHRVVSGLHNQLGISDGSVNESAALCLLRPERGVTSWRHRYCVRSSSVWLCRRRVRTSLVGTTTAHGTAGLRCARCVFALCDHLPKRPIVVAISWALRTAPCQHDSQQHARAIFSRVR